MSTCFHFIYNNILTFFLLHEESFHLEMSTITCLKLYNCSWGLEFVISQQNM